MTEAVGLDGRVAVVTGGGSGVGRAIARALGEAGARVHVLGRRREPLAETIHGLSAATRDTCDVRDAADVERALGALDRIDVLVNSAGVIRAAEAHAVTAEDAEEVIRTNLLGAFHCCRAALPGMRARGAGDIVNVASVAAERDFPTMAAYAASKAGVLALSGAIRSESRERGIRVLDVVAGAVDTEMWASFWPEAPRERMMSVASVAHAVLAALTLPRDASMERVVLRPIGGDL